MRRLITMIAALALCCAGPAATAGYAAKKNDSGGMREKRLILPVAVTVCLPAGVQEALVEPALRNIGFAPVFIDKARRAAIVLQLNRKPRYQGPDAYKLVIGRRKRATASADAEAGLRNALSSLADMAEKRCGRLEFPYCVLGALGDISF